MDKDTLVGAMNASHDSHLLAIDNKEDSIASRVKRDLSSLLDSIQKAELERNRVKVVEIEQYVAHEKDELETGEQQQ